MSSLNCLALWADNALLVSDVLQPQLYRDWLTAVYDFVSAFKQAQIALKMCVFTFKHERKSWVGVCVIPVWLQEFSVSSFQSGL